MGYDYQPEVLEALAAHGLRPTSSTRPGLAKDYVTGLYLYELRRLRDALLRGEFPKPEFTTRVSKLRSRYALMSLPSARWTT